MNILVFSWRDPKHPLAGGAEQVMHEHMKGWVDAGNSVTLFSSKVGDLSKRETLEGVEIIRGGYQYLGVQLAGLIYYLENKNKYDFIIDQFHGIPFFTPLYVSKPKLAVIQEPARDVWFKNPLPWPFNWIIGLLGYLMEPLIFLFYHRTYFMTGSATARENLKGYGIKVEKITVVPHGVIGPKKQSKTKKEETLTICHLGILAKDKGIEDSLKVFQILNKMGEFNFWVIGKPETEKYFSYLRKMVRRYGLEGKVNFWGYVSNQKKFELLGRSHILINLSVHEGWGLVNIEANAMGTPVVAYKSAGLIDSVKDGQSGIIVEKNSPETITEAVVLILGNKKLYTKLQNGAISWSKNFSWKVSIEKSLLLLK